MPDITTPALIRPGVAYWSLSRVLDLRSGEAELLCRRAAHVSGHPKFCHHGCDLQPAATLTVRAVLPFKRHSRLWNNSRPIVVEAGWLLDGHHRVAHAVVTQQPGIWVQTVRGRLSSFVERYEDIKKQAANGS